MPPTADTTTMSDITSERTAPIADAETMRIPDRDNPMLWRAKAKEGRRGAVRLLEALTDDELARYRAMVSDQVRHEEQRVWLKVMLIVLAAVIIVYDMVHGYANGVTRWHVAALVLALALAYWPWRVMIYRRLWVKHQRATDVELARRRDGGRPIDLGEDAAEETVGPS